MAWVVGIGIFLFLLFAFPKQTLVLVGVILVVVGAVASWQWWEHHQQQLAREQLKTEARYQGFECKDPRPIGVMFWNQGKRTITEIWFSLQAHRKGFSKPVLRDWNTTDLIVKPGEAYVLCWGVPLRYGQEKPDDIGELIWSAPVSAVSFSKD